MKKRKQALAFLLAGCMAFGMTGCMTKGEDKSANKKEKHRKR